LSISYSPFFFRFDHSRLTSMPTLCQFSQAIRQFGPRFFFFIPASSPPCTPTTVDSFWCCGVWWFGGVFVLGFVLFWGVCFLIASEIIAVLCQRFCPRELDSLSCTFLANSSVVVPLLTLVRGARISAAPTSTFFLKLFPWILAVHHPSYSPPQAPQIPQHRNRRTGSPSRPLSHSLSLDHLP